MEEDPDVCDHGVDVEAFCYECHKLYGDLEWTWLMGLDE